MSKNFIEFVNAKLIGHNACEHCPFNPDFKGCQFGNIMREANKMEQYPDEPCRLFNQLKNTFDWGKNR